MTGIFGNHVVFLEGGELSFLGLLFWLMDGLLALLLLLLIPFLVVRFALFVVHRPTVAPQVEIPLLNKLSILSGFLFGFLLISEALQRGLGDVANIFAEDAYWDLTFWGFLTGPTNPFHIEVYDIFWPETIVGVGSLLCFLLGIVAIAIVVWRVAPRGRVINMLFASFVMLAASAYMTVYAVSAMAWLMAKLNFFVFGLLLLYRASKRHTLMKS
jgi:hypothetical protein